MNENLIIQFSLQLNSSPAVEFIALSIPSLYKNENYTLSPEEQRLFLALKNLVVVESLKGK